MKITAEYLHDKWNGINYYEGGFKQIVVEHPLEWYVGYKEINQKTLMLINCNEAETPFSSKSILVSKGYRADGRWTLSFTLMRQEQDSVFELLCADIMNYSQVAPSEKDALNRKGLLGELLYLLQTIDDGSNPLKAVQGWVGPDGADQDFVYADGWREIKSIGLSAETIGISSLEQLNSTEAGEIIVMRIDKCAPEHAGAVSLMDAVHIVNSRFDGIPDAAALLEIKLTKYGYIELPEYGEQKYHFSGKQRYCVDSAFPKLTPQNAAPQIVSAQYSISLAAIEPWKMESANQKSSPKMKKPSLSR